MSERHERLQLVVQKLPSDYEPYGLIERDGCDCSCGCRYFMTLHVEKGVYANFPTYEGHDLDWGVCTNQMSPRAGLLTFEHQGGANCFEHDDEDERKTAAYKKVIDEMDGHELVLLDRCVRNACSERRIVTRPKEETK